MVEVLNVRSLLSIVFQCVSVIQVFKKLCSYELFVNFILVK